MKKAAFLFFRVEVRNAACAVQYLVVVQTMLVRCPKNLDFTRLFGCAFGVPEVIRTPDLPLRRRSLYPAELRKHITIVIISQFCNFVKCLFDKKSWLAIATSIDALAVGITFAFLNIFLEGVGILK